MRLTKDLKTPHDDTTYVDDLINVDDKENIVLTKLKHYENIEDEYCITDIKDLRRRLDLSDKYSELSEQLGIDLNILFEALTVGIWIKTTIIENGQIKNLLFFYEDVSLYKDCLYVYPRDIYDEKVYLHEHGKTWALAKEELL